MRWSSRIPCNHVHEIKGRCVLEFGHVGPHQWLHPEVEPDPGVRPAPGAAAGAAAAAEVDKPPERE